VFILFNLVTYSQDNPDKIILNPEGLVLDSVNRVIVDKNLSLDYKFKVANSITNFQYIELLTPIYRSVLAEAKKQQNDSIQMQMYNRLMVINVVRGNNEDTKLYLDSAALLEPKVDNLQILLRYFNYAALYYTNIGNKEKSHEVYYKVIDICERIGTKEEKEKIIFTLYNLSISYAQENDLVTFKKNVDKMVKVEQEIKTPLAKILTNALLGQYYYAISENIVFSDLKYSELMLDSIEIYGNKIFEIQDEVFLKAYETLWRSIMSENYIRLSYAESRRESPDWDKVLNYLQKGEAELSQQNNPITLFQVSLTKGIANFHIGDYSQAIDELLEAQKLNDEYNQKTENGFLTDKRIVSQYLANSYEKINDYQNAYKYRKLESETLQKISDISRYQVIKEMEAKYDSQFKENEIKNLREQAIYQQRIRNLYAGLSGLFLIILLVSVILYRMRRKAAKNELEIIQMKKEEVELQLKLKDEQAARIELEKYEALLEIHLKELEIEGKDSELEELRHNKQKLDVDIQMYSEKLKRYEEDVEKEHQNSRTILAKPVVEEIKEMIIKRLSPESIYISRLDAISNAFLNQLQIISQGSISVAYLKYCICFTIGMNLKDVTECFCVEPSSIHMVRYRLKKKLKLDNNDDLNIYLKNLLRKY